MSKRKQRVTGLRGAPGPVRQEDFKPGELGLYRAAVDRWKTQSSEQILKEVAILFHLGVSMSR